MQRSLCVCVAILFVLLLSFAGSGAAQFPFLPSFPFATELT